MQALPPDQRDVMHLVCIEDMSYAETASLLGIPPGTVMSRLARARAAVARQLGIN
jgi:RNA polymerase sigma-70 factor (ECF subfamily)